MRYVVGFPEIDGLDRTRYWGLALHGLPLQKPPYGQITAIDLDKGEILWRVAHGETPDEVRTNALLKGLDIPRTGRPGIIGVLTTKTLVIAGESGTFTNAEGKEEHCCVPTTRLPVRMLARSICRWGKRARP